MDKKEISDLVDQIIPHLVAAVKTGMVLLVEINQSGLVFGTPEFIEEITGGGRVQFNCYTSDSDKMMEVFGDSVTSVVDGDELIGHDTYDDLGLGQLSPLPPKKNPLLN